MKKLLFPALFALLLFPSLLMAATEGDTLQYEIQGKITYKSGTVVKMQKIVGDEMPAIAQQGELSKQFNTEILKAKVSGWLAIGEMKVTSVTADIVTFNLMKELSVVTENGVKKNHFEIGKEVKFVWKKAVSADEAAFRKGQDLVETDMDKALEFYRQAVSLNPGHDKALNMMGMVMSKQNKSDSALICFKKAYNSNPRSNQYAKNVCISVYATGEVEEGYMYAKKAVENDFSDAEAWYLKGLMYYLLKKDSITEADQKQVLADFDKAVQLAPEQAFYLSERALLRSGFGNPNGACEDALKAKQLGAENGDELIKTYCKD
jgi:tetratricopeptide (TPR) repeat protein